MKFNTPNIANTHTQMKGFATYLFKSNQQNEQPQQEQHAWRQHQAPRSNIGI